MACWSLVLFGLLALLSRVDCNETQKYDNYTLIRMTPTNITQLEALQVFVDPEAQVEVLKRSRDLNDTLDVLVPPERLAFIEDFAKGKDLQYEVKTKNYSRILEPAERAPRRRYLRRDFIHRYNSFSAISDFLETTARTYPQLVRLQTVGASYEGRELKLVKISQNPDAGNPIIFIDAGIHAREWVAPAMALYLISRLTSEPESRRSELDHVDWYILPVVNPDGYEYTRLGNRMWRKTRSPTAHNCYGVDGNRNYGYKWAVSGVSSNPCDRETYAGPKPFSESETRIVRNIMLENVSRMKLYVSLHSYGQYLVYPWGYTGEFLPKTWKRLDNMARGVSNAVQRAGGPAFTVMSAGKWYPAAGGSDDFAFSLGVPYSYTMELTDGYEFIYPEELLREQLPQYYAGFKYFASQIRAEFGGKRENKRKLATERANKSIATES